MTESIWSAALGCSICTISGWARTPGYIYDGISCENEVACNAISKVPINLDGSIFLDSSSQVTVERCYLHDPRLSANSWQYNHSTGPEGIVVKSNSSSGNHVGRYNDGIEGYDNGSINGSFARDSDIYGNMIAYGQDDVRFFGNKGQDFFYGISVAPNKQVPSYLFNNTFHAWGYGGIAGVGFSSYPASEPDERTRFCAVSRNNIVYNRDTPSATYTVTAISDQSRLTSNSVDFDNLATVPWQLQPWSTVKGREAYGMASWILRPPSWTWTVPNTTMTYGLMVPLPPSMPAWS